MRRGHADGESASPSSNLPRRAEEEPRESEAKFRQLAESLPQLVWTCRGDGPCDYLSPQWVEYTGIPEAEQLGFGWLNQLHPDDRERTIAAWNVAVESNKPFDVEFRIRRKDGIYRWFKTRAVAVRDGEGRIVKWFGTNTDIDDQRRAAEELQRHREHLEEMVAERTAALRESEAKYRALVEQGPSITYTAALDEASSTLYISPQIECILGYTRAEYSADPDAWRKMVHPDDLERVTADVVKIHQTGEPFSAEYRMIAKDGRIVWIRDQGALVRDAAGKPLFLQGVMYDITELKTAENELRKLSKELEQRVKDRTAQLEAANKELDAFSYSVSHDLRAPLRAIDGFSHAVLEACSSKLDEEHAQNLRRVRAAAQKMSRLIEDLLSLARLTQQAMRRAPVDLSRVARSIADELKQREPGRNVDFVIADGVTAEGDADLLEIVMQNLLENAWKFTSKKGQAKIEFGCLSISDFRLQIADVKNHPLQSAISNLTSQIYFVRDDGVGFDPAYAGKLFGTFQRLHSEAEFPGTGIGLATVERIIHRHGGRTWAEGEVGKGATFYFTL
ncbi:MAG: PAS domain-containing protein [Verrucomicrobiota bacterium]